jgi:Zn-dependent protease with chaperone function
MQGSLPDTSGTAPRFSSDTRPSDSTAHAGSHHRLGATTDSADSAPMSVNQPAVTIDERRGWARTRAVVVCLVGIGVIALSAAMLALVVLAAVARFWTWIRRRDIDSAGVWGIATETAVGAGVIAVVISFAIFFWWFWTGAVDSVLSEVKAERVDEPKGEGQRRTMNLLEELSIGLGRPLPELWVTKDDVPNALSMRSSKRRVVCTTSGVASLPRDELEAMLAHEMGHLWALDAHWVASGMVALARGRRAGLILLTSGAVMLVLLLAGWKSVGILWSTSLFAIAMMVLGAMCTSLLRRLELNMRHNADVIADVAAVRLARNPGSLAALCARLADNDSEVGAAGWRSELMWFEMVESADLAGDKDPEAKVRTRRELVARATAAYAQAGTEIPAEHLQRFERWLTDHAGAGATS